MATKPVKVLSDLLTKKQIIKQDLNGNTLFNISGNLENGHVSSSLPITASYFVGDGRYLTNISASGGISSVSTSGSITGSGLVTNPISLKDPLIINTVTASVGFSGNLYGTASFANTSSYAINAGLSTVATSGSITGSGIVENPISLKDPLIIGAVTASYGFSGNLIGTASFATSASYAQTSSYAINALTASTIIDGATTSIQNAYKRLRYQFSGTFDGNGEADILLPLTQNGGDSFPISDINYIKIDTLVDEDGKWVNDLLAFSLDISSSQIHISLNAPAVPNTGFRIIAVNENINRFIIG
jgi:hypothetical protein